MAQIIWTDPALSELDEIANYITLDKPSAAAKLVKQVFERIDQLSDFPDSEKKTDRNQRFSLFRNRYQAVSDFLSP